jgi:hypothetical protein
MKAELIWHGRWSAVRVCITRPLIVAIRRGMQSAWRPGNVNHLWQPSISGRSFTEPGAKLGRRGSCLGGPFPGYWIETIALLALGLSGCVPYTPYVDPAYAPPIVGAYRASDLSDCREQYQATVRRNAPASADLTVAMLGNLGQAMVAATSAPHVAASEAISACMRSKGYRVRQ